MPDSSLTAHAHTRSTIAITLGDPAGIGPEILLRVMQDGLDPGVAWIVFGPEWGLTLSAERLGLEVPPLNRIVDLKQAQKGLNLFDVGGPAPNDFQFGRVQASCGSAAVLAVEAAARGCLSEHLSAMVTCPINKEAIHAAGYVDDIGHQEILARLAGVEQTATMLMTPGLKVVHLSTHKSLIEAARFVTAPTIVGKLRLMRQTLTQWGMPDAKIAVAALNPHGGEGGLLGKEELEEIAPAVQQARAQHINVVGPLPADSVFNRAINGEFDVVLALYHDQGHIAIKVHNFHESTTATLGIPFVRTSVDHGTAFDIAGQGIADATGLHAAVAAAKAIVNAELS